MTKAIEANLRLVEILDADGDGRISEFEYLSRMLVFTRLVNKTELDVFNAFILVLQFVSLRN